MTPLIGGTHFIGPYVVQTLHEKGHEITLFNRGQTKYSFPFQVKLIQDDRANLLSFKDKFLDFSPDVVIDMIPYSENDASQLANTFRGQAQRVVVISSCDVYSAYDRLWNVGYPSIGCDLISQNKSKTRLITLRKIMPSKGSLQPLD